MGMAGFRVPRGLTLGFITGATAGVGGPDVDPAGVGGGGHAAASLISTAFAAPFCRVIPNLSLNTIVDQSSL